MLLLFYPSGPQLRAIPSPFQEVMLLGFGVALYFGYRTYLNLMSERPRRPDQQ